MAEVVFQNLEEMLPELEELEREGVFTREELRLIIKKRTDFEYKLQKRIMEKNDILNYLEYEVKLDLLRKKRSKKLKLKPYNTAALAMSRKIHSLFRKGLLKFSDDFNLWMQYIDFCKKMGSHRAIGLAFGKLLQQHSNNPSIWLMAAKHEAEEMNNIENARLLFQKGLRSNKLSAELWHEYFRLELMHVDKIKKRKKMLLDGGIEVHDDDEPKEPEKIEDFLLNKTAEIVYKNAIMSIHTDLEFRLKFVTICQDFEDTIQLEDLIYDSLQSDFKDDEALSEAACIKPITKLKRSYIIKDSDWLRVEEEVDNNFQLVFKTKKTNIMYEKYLNCFAKLMKESISPEQMQRRLKMILKILESGEQDNCMTELMYLFWSEILAQIGESTASEDCLNRALKVFDKSLQIWQHYLFMKIENESSWETLSLEFKRCFSLLDEKDQIPIWRLYIDASMALSNEEIEHVFAEMLKSKKEVKDAFLPLYMNWLYETDGLSSVRTFYIEHLKYGVDLKFILSCIDIENLQDKKNLKQLRFLYEKAVNDFGERSADIWLSYIRMEKDYASADFERVSKLYLKAKKTLTGVLNAEFITQYSLM